MKISTKKALGIIAAASLALHLLVYLLFHLPTLVFYIESDFWYDAVYYIHELLGMLLSALLPSVCAVAALALYPTGGVRRPLLLCCLLIVDLCAVYIADNHWFCVQGVVCYCSSSDKDSNKYTRRGYRNPSNSR